MHNEVKRKLILSIRIEINDNEKMYGIENVKQKQFFHTNINDDFIIMYIKLLLTK